MSSLPQTITTPIEARAKRTHARRSCDVCKVRKTRCELPDLEVPSGPNPLPTDKSCHRCRVLALPCIVDDSGKKQRKRARDDKETKTPNLTSDANGQQIPSSDNTPKKRAAKGSKRPRSSSQNLQQQITQSAPLSRRHSIINHSLDVLQGISPIATHQPASLDEATRIQPELTLYGQKDIETTTKSMRLHGRPAELTCAMMKVAYSKIDVKRRPPVDVEEIDLNQLVDEQMRARLQPGFTQLKTFHPHLESLERLYKSHNTSSEVTATSLLLSTVIYLASLSLPSDPTVQHLRTVLIPYITYYRDRVVLQAPKSFAALQALELLSVHAPLGVLPYELTNLKDLAVGRGVNLVSTYLMSVLEFGHLIDSILSGPGPVFTFECGDFWLWSSLIADQATSTFEEFESIKPENLNQARRITEDFMNYDERSILWHDGIQRGDLAILVGRLSICDKLARLEEVLDTISRIKTALEISASDPSFDPVRDILSEMENFERRMEEVDRRHDTIMGLLSSSDSRGVESGWLTYRTVRRRYETGKVYVTGLRVLMATHFLPGSLHGYPDLPPPFINTAQGVSYAMSRAFAPADIVKFITDTDIPKPAVEAVWDWGRKRGVNAEACLVACADISQNLVNDLHNGGYISIIPSHDIFCIATEAAKVLIEMEAGTIQILRTTNQIHKAFRARSWLIVMNQVSQIFKTISDLSTSSADDSGGDTISNGCSNLIGSMVRSAETWTKLLEKELPNDIKIDQQPHPHSHNEGSEGNLPPYVLDSNVTNNEYISQQQQQQHNDNESLRQNPNNNGISTSHQQYMDSSDRWMASSSITPTGTGTAVTTSTSTPSGGGHLNPPQQLPLNQHEHLQSVIEGDRQQQQSSTSSYQHNYQIHGNGNGDTNDGRLGQPLNPQPPQSGPYPNQALDQILSEMFCYNLPPQQGNPGQHRPIPAQPLHHSQHHQIQRTWPQDMRSQ